MADADNKRETRPRSWWNLIAGAALLSALLFTLYLLTENLRILREQQAAGEANSREHLFWMIFHDEAEADERTSAFLKLVSDGNTEWLGARLARLDLTSVNLSGQNLRLVDLEGSKMKEAVLIEADLYRTLLKTVDLTDADLENANVVESDLLRATLDGANLRKAILTGSSLDQVSARNSVFVLADLSATRLSLADLTGADFTGADLTDANFEGAILREANLALARMEGTNLQDADLTNTNWWRARGLTAAQLAALTRDFEPNLDAPSSLREDYKLWSGVK